MKELLFRFFYVHVWEKDTAGLPGMNKNRWIPKDRRFFQLTHHNVTTSLTSLQLFMLMVQGWCNTCGKWRGTYYIICPVSFSAWKCLKLLNMSVDKIWALILVPTQMGIFHTFCTFQSSWFHNNITFHFSLKQPDDYSCSHFVSEWSQILFSHATYAVWGSDTRELASHFTIASYKIFLHWP